MAFNHVGNCDCPVGDCWCGVDSSKDSSDKILSDFTQKLIPKDLYIIKDLKVPVELIESSRYYPPNLEYWVLVGEIDNALTKLEATEAIFQFYGLMVKLQYSKKEMSERMSRFIYSICSANGLNKEHNDLKATIGPMFIKISYEL